MPAPGKPAGATRDPFIPGLKRLPRLEKGAAPDIYCCVVDGEGNCYSATVSDNARDTVVILGLGGPSPRAAPNRGSSPGHPSEVKPGKRPRLTPIARFGAAARRALHGIRSRFPQATADALTALGHPVELWSDVAPSAGAVCAVMRDPSTGWLYAGADPRREAYAIVW